MGDNRITGIPAPAPASSPVPGPKRPNPEEIYQTFGGAIIGFSAGLVAGLTVSSLMGVVLAIAGAIGGGYVGWAIAVSRRPRGVRVRDGLLPGGHRPRPPSLPFATAITTSPIIRPVVDRLGGHRYAITGLALSPDGTQLASCDQEGSAIVYDLTTGFQVWTARDFGHSAVSLAYSPDGRLLAVAGHEETRAKTDFFRTAVRVYDALDGGELRRIELSRLIGPVAFLPDRRLVIGVSVRLSLWELETPSELATLPTDSFSGYNVDEVAALATREDIVLVGCRHGQRACVLAVNGGGEVMSFHGHFRRFSLVRGGAVVAVAVSPSGHFVLTGGLDGYARIWALRSGEEVQRFDGHWGWWGWHGVTGVGWLSEQEAVSTGEDGTLRQWDARTGRELRRIDHHRAITRLAVIGRTVATGANDGSIRVWAL